MNKNILSLCITLFLGLFTFGQKDSTASFLSVYDSHELFAPLHYEVNSSSFRSANGEPGPSYWQNRADYTIQASLDEQKIGRAHV